MSFREFLGEMPQNIPDFHNMTRKNAIKNFKLCFENWEYCDELNGFTIIARDRKPTDFIVYETSNGDPVAAVHFKQTGISKDNKSHLVYTAKFTLSWDGKKGFMYNAYKTFSKYSNNSYIMTDAKQTEHSKKVWKSWYAFKKNIDEILQYDFDKKEVISKNIDDLWGNDENYRKYRLLVKFK